MSDAKRRAVLGAIGGSLVAVAGYAWWRSTPTAAVYVDEDAIRFETGGTTLSGQVDAANLGTEGFGAGDSLDPETGGFTVRGGDAGTVTYESGSLRALSFTVEGEGTADVFRSGELIERDARSFSREFGPAADPTASAAAPTSLDDHFDYPTARLEDEGWRATNGRYETRRSALLAHGGRNRNPHVAHPQTVAAGTFEMRGIVNESSFFGVRCAFVADRPHLENATRGYMIQWMRREVDEVKLVRLDPGGAESLLLLTESHGGRVNDVRVERDPETYEFACYYDGDLVGTVTDDTYTESAYWTNRFDGSFGSQRVDRVTVRPP